MSGAAVNKNMEHAIHYLRPSSLFVVIAVLSCSVQMEEPTIRFPYQWLDTPGFGGDIDQQALPEPSGICFHPSRNTLFVVSDEGELAEIQKDGTPVQSFQIPGDLEGLTMDPASGLLFIIVEAVDEIIEVNPDTGDVLRRFPINRRWGDEAEFLQKNREGWDNGCEAISFISDSSHPEGGYFFVANQWDPPCILQVEAPLKSAVGKTSEAHIVAVLPFHIDDPAAMYYDDQTDLLNVVSDADNILVELTREGRMVRQYAFLGDNQEGLTKDDEGYLYIAQDTGGILKVRDLR